LLSRHGSRCHREQQFLAICLRSFRNDIVTK
jgi:hypothetical protein